MQASASTGSPRQCSLPPGSVQARILHRDPWPHDVEHWLHFPHGCQLPDTAGTNKQQDHQRWGYSTVERFEEKKLNKDKRKEQRNNYILKWGGSSSVCIFYVDLSPRFPQEFPKISTRFPQDFYKISPRFLRDFPKSSPRFP